MKKDKKGGTKKIPKTELVQYLDFLNDYKKYIGLEGWQIKLKAEAREMGSSLAEVEPNILEKNLDIELGIGFLTQSDDEKANILFHELVHGRVNVTQEMIDEFKDTQEEHMVNDIVRGFEQFGELKLPRKK